MLFADWPKQHFLNSTSEWVYLACSEYTSRAVSIPRVQWVYLACSEYTSHAAVSIPRVQWAYLACSEYTSREVYSDLCLFLSIVYSVFQRCPTRDEISFPVGQSNCKKKSIFFLLKFKIFKKFHQFQNCHHISKF